MKIASFIIHHQIMTWDNLYSPNLLSLDFMIKTQTIMNWIDNIILFRYENQEVKLPPKIQKIKKKRYIRKWNKIRRYVSHEILNEFRQFLLLNDNLQHFNFIPKSHGWFVQRWTRLRYCSLYQWMFNYEQWYTGITLQFRDKFNKIDNLILQKKKKT